MYIFHYIFLTFFSFSLLCTYICTIIPLRFTLRAVFALRLHGFFGLRPPVTRFQRFFRQSLCRLKFTRLSLGKIFPRFSPVLCTFFCDFFSNFFRIFLEFFLENFSIFYGYSFSVQFWRWKYPPFMYRLYNIYMYIYMYIYYNIYIYINMYINMYIYML